MRDTWTEEDVRSLPPEENNAFERKSGRLFDEGKWLKPIAKAICAFANGGGGHVILGVDNKGVLDGVRDYEGKQPRADHLSRTVVTLLDPPLIDFQVETVTLQPGTLPAGRSIYIINVPDSRLAPHQSTQDHVHYCRHDKQSDPASAFELDLLRNRQTRPSFRVGLEGMDEPVLLRKGNFHTILFKFRIRVQNTGNVSADHWRLRLIELENLQPTPRDALLVLYEETPESHQFNRALWDESYLFPDETRIITRIFGLRFIMGADVWGTVEHWLSKMLDATLMFLIATPTSRGEEYRIRLRERLLCELAMDMLKTAGLPSETSRR